MTLYYNFNIIDTHDYEYKVDDEYVIKVLSELNGEIDSSNFEICISSYRDELAKIFYKRAYREYQRSRKDYGISFRRVNIEMEDFQLK